MKLEDIVNDSAAASTARGICWGAIAIGVIVVAIGLIVGNLTVAIVGLGMIAGTGLYTCIQCMRIGRYIRNHWKAV